MKRTMIAMCAVLALVAGRVQAEGLDFALNGVRFNFALLPLPVPTGADVEFRYGLAEVGALPLEASLRLAGGYEDKRILRDALSGDPVAAPTGGIGEAGGEQRYQSPNFQWDAGLVMGLAKKDKGNLIEAFLLYRGRYDYYATTLSTAVFKDLNGLWGTSFITGLGYDAVERDSRRVKTGAAAEVSFEWGPAMLNTALGPTDFYRVDAKAQGYLPLFSLGQAAHDSLNLVSAYLAGYAGVDYAGGSAVPVYIMQSFGGRDLRDSLGDCVRGYPSRSYDAALKTVANAELRLLGPALLGQAWCMPIAYAFFDIGYYAGLPGASSKKDASGTIMSTGGGLVFDIFDFAYLGAYAGLKIPGADPLYAVYGETDNMFWKISFLLHF